MVNVLCSLLLHALGTWKRHHPIKAVYKHLFDGIKKAVFKETLVYLMRAGCGVRWVAIIDAVVQCGARRVKLLITRRTGGSLKSVAPLVSPPEWIYSHNIRSCTKFRSNVVTGRNVPKYHCLLLCY